MDFKKKIILTVLSFAIATLMLSVSSTSLFKKTFVFTFAQENEAEVETDIEQENKCKDDTDCENENELNNQFTITNITQTQTESQPTTLTVTKLVQCQQEGQSSECPPELGPEDFTITVTGNNPEPSEFPGSSEGTLITLGAGEYTVNEKTEILFPPLTELYVTLSGDCIQIDDDKAEGTIEDGETQTCTIENTVNFIAD